MSEFCTPIVDIWGSGSEITWFYNFLKYHQLQQLYSIKWEDVKKLLATAYSPSSLDVKAYK
jgi:hypothetical protein